MYNHFTVFKKIRSENQLHKLIYNKDLISKKKKVKKMTIAINKRLETCEIESIPSLEKIQNTS